MILTESPSLDIFLKSDHFVAGDHITGEILLSSPKPRQTLILTSTGRETLQITPAKGSTKSLRTEIYSFSQTIEDSTQQNQSLFPFSLKIPAFCPATFNFDHIDTNQTQINAEVVYEISAVFDEKVQTNPDDFKEICCFQSKIQTTL
jgi:Arrestin (or S-antigen), N-terminal domain.